MSFTYSGNPAESNLDKVRFLVGQTSTSDDVLLEDEEITWAIGDQPNVTYAAAVCCETLATRYALEATAMSVGQTRITWTDRAKWYREQSNILRRKAMLSGVTPFAGGVSQSDKDTRADDSDRLRAFTKIGGMDYQEPGSTSI